MARWLAVAGAIILPACATTDHAPTDPNPDTSASAAERAINTPFIPAYCKAPGEGTLASVVRVATLDGNDGSGVIIAPDRVLTAAHVVTSDHLALVLIGDSYRDARVIATDVEADLALLAVDTAQLAPIRVSRTGLFRDEPVWTVGFPLALDQVASAGHYQHNVDGAIYTSASTNAGGSGGGLLRCEDGEFELAGMIRGYGAYWRGGELLRIKDLSISVPADTIADFALRSGVPLAAIGRL